MSPYFDLWQLPFRDTRPLWRRILSGVKWWAILIAWSACVGAITVYPWYVGVRVIVRRLLGH